MIINNIDDEVPDFLLNEKVQDYTMNVDWDWDRLRVFLPAAIIDKVASVAAPEVGEGQDRIFWKGTNDGCFTVDSAYNLLAHEGWNEKDADSKRIWKWRGRERIIMFWQVKHNSLATRERIHSALWRNWVKRNKQSAFFTADLQDCIHSFLHNLGGGHLVFFLEMEKGRLWCYLKDDNGEWLSGATRKLGEAAALTTKLWGVIEGLNLAWNLRYRNCGDWSISVKHTKRNANMAEDCMANYSLSVDQGLTIYAFPPRGLIPVLVADVLGSPYPKQCLFSFFVVLFLG
ncbi:hypothetical protein L6164_006178 [Bauhinia variegata]|uniref:Uncharacterized protein n=1 Tax=Bauhinia variegata TaxID=167791 RepID=A0ACB9PVQ8_BAUVA|nr:hypothetical protein L6164_006178 [Bauhinia variegata]